MVWGPRIGVPLRIPIPDSFSGIPEIKKNQLKAPIYHSLNVRSHQVTIKQSRNSRNILPALRSSRLLEFALLVHLPGEIPVLMLEIVPFCIFQVMYTYHLGKSSGNTLEITCINPSIFNSTLQGTNTSPTKATFEDDDFPFPELGYVTSLEGNQGDPGHCLFEKQILHITACALSSRIRYRWGPAKVTVSRVSFHSARKTLPETGMSCWYLGSMDYNPYKGRLDTSRKWVITQLTN